MFADDTNFMRSISSLNEIKDELIPALCKVYNWLRCNKLSLNTVKTEFMILLKQLMVLKSWTNVLCLHHI